MLAATMLRYLDQLALSLRPASVKRAETMLRRFAGDPTNNHPEVESLIDVERVHIEAFKRYLPTRPGKNGRPPLSEMTIRMTLGTLRTFFERVSEWDYPDAPRRVLSSTGSPHPRCPATEVLVRPLCGQTDEPPLMLTRCVAWSSRCWPAPNSLLASSVP